MAIWSYLLQHLYFSVHFFRYRISLPTLVELLRTVPLLGPFAQARYPGLWKEQMCAKRHGHFVDEFGHYPSVPLALWQRKEHLSPQELKGSFENPLSSCKNSLTKRQIWLHFFGKGDSLIKIDFPLTAKSRKYFTPTLCLLWNGSVCYFYALMWFFSFFQVCWNSTSILFGLVWYVLIKFV